MEVASIPDLPLAECLQIIAKHFDTTAIAARIIDSTAVLEYYRQSDRGYRLFHSKQGAMHVALNCDEEFSTEGYLGQVELIAGRLQQFAAKNVLEVGCGVGYNSRNLAERFPASQLTGVDLSPEHVATAKKEASKLPNLAFEQGDFHRLRYDDNSFDAIFAVECLCQGTDWQGALAEAQRVLRQQGRFIVIDCFRQASLDSYDSDLQFAAQLVEKTMAVEEFAVLADWLRVAETHGFRVCEQLDLSEAISHNLARFYSLSRRFFKMPLAARAFLKAFPPRLIENAISGLLMPFTVGSGVHRYFLLTLEKK
ncbi:MAG: methyltransferase domain-containing protein [Bythopirellula sp.]|nr:methyltransferase domain-containing protein [Bythopirellula sp.]